MTQYAVVKFQVQAATASWGESGGTVRETSRTPTYSGIIGMVGAALGLPRGDKGIFAMAAEYAMACATYNVGTPFEDFHTVETPSREVSDRAYRNRAEELQRSTGTIITRRRYRSDVAYLIALFALSDTPTFTPEQIAVALNGPQYLLCAGRRNSPLTAPTDAKTMVASSVSDALGQDTHIAFDSRLTPGSCDVHHTVARHDMPVGIRQFEDRTECLA